MSTANNRTMAYSILGRILSVSRDQHPIPHLGLWRAAMVGRCGQARLSTRLETRAFEEAHP